MKLCRIGNLGKEKPAIIDKDGSYKDLSSKIRDFNPESLKVWDKSEKLKIVTHHWGTNKNKGFEIYEYIDELIKRRRKNNIKIVK